MTARGAIATALALAGAFALGRLASAPAPAPAKPERIVERGPQRTIIERAAAPDLDEVRRVIREELARAATRTPDADDEPAEEPPRDRTAAVAQAHAALDTGMADGRWTDDDRARLRGTLAELSPAEADVIFDKLLLALNAGQLQPEAHGPPI